MIVTRMPWDNDDVMLEKDALKAEKLERLRDEFAMRAPVEPQNWFKPVVPEPPNLPKLSDKEILAMRGYDQEDYGHVDYDLGKKLSNERNKIHREYLNEIDRQKYIQWPYAWADEVLKAREIKNG